MERATYTHHWSRLTLMAREHHPRPAQRGVGERPGEAERTAGAAPLAVQRDCVHHPARGKRIEAARITALHCKITVADFIPLRAGQDAGLDLRVIGRAFDGVSDRGEEGVWLGQFEMLGRRFEV